MQNCVIYWLFDSTCTDPFLHGYIGFTKHLPRRVTEHRRKFGEAFEVKVLFTGTRAECIAEEIRLRPEPLIGWNVLSGGFGGRIYPKAVAEKIGNKNRGKKRSEEFKENLRQKLTGKKHDSDRIARFAVHRIGRPISPKVRAIFTANRSLAHTPDVIARRNESLRNRVYTEEERAQFATYSKGRKRSEAHRAAIAEANRRRVVSEETRAKMRIAAKARMTPEVRAKLSATKLQRNRERRGEGNGEGQMVHG
jgi:hypothetical protein